MTDIDTDMIYKNFKSSVNMTAKEIKQWLTTDESKSVGIKRPGEKETIGRQSGKQIVKILTMKKAELTPGDFVHMRKVFSYIRRHSAQEPKNIITSRWRYSLMNWGHDPVKHKVHGK